MNRLDELIMHAARRAEQQMYPVDGSFLHEHDVTLYEAGDLSARLSVVLAGFAAADPDLQGQIIMLGAMALAELPPEIRDLALANLQRDQLARKLSR